MGKKNKKAAPTRLQSPVRQSLEAFQRETPVPLQQLGAPVAALWLGVATPQQAADRRCTIWLAPSTVTSLGIAFSDKLLVGIAPLQATSPSPGLQSCALQTAELQPCPLWPQVQAACGVEAAAETPPCIQPGAFLQMAPALLATSAAPGTVMLSSTLADCLGRPAAGSSILLYKAALDAYADVTEEAVTPLHSSDLYLRLILNGHAGGPLVLPILAPMRQPELLPGQASPLLTRTLGGRQRQQQPAIPVPDPMGKAAGDWVLSMLGALGDATSQQRHLLQRLAQAHLQGRHMLPGNPVTLPLLGRSCMFQVVEAMDTSAVNNMHHISVGQETVVKLLGPDEKLPKAGEEVFDGQQDAQAQQDDKLEQAVQHACETVEEGSKKSAAQAVRRAFWQGKAALLSGQSFDALGGLHTQKKALQELVGLPLQEPHRFARFGLQPPIGVLLWGPPGTGKSHLARAASHAARAQVLLLNGPGLLSAVYGESEAAIQAVFAAAKHLAPAVVLIDEADALGAARSSEKSGLHGNAAEGTSARVVASLISAMDSLQGAARVMVIAATNRPEGMDPALRRPGRFDREVEVGVPSPAERADILRNMMRSMNHYLTLEQVEALAAHAHGCVGADLSAMCTTAGFLALRRLVSARTAPDDQHKSCSAKPVVQLEDMQQAQAQIRPSALREMALEVPNAEWGDVGGLQEVKQRLQEAVQWPQLHPEALARLGAQAPRGVLLMGPPGCSKTLLARAVAAEAKLNFLAVKGPELLSKWVGASEQAVAQLFARARAAAPAIVFFDEIDGLAGLRDSAGSGSSGVEDRVIAQLLAEMDGLQSRRGVVVLAATNRPDRLDSALLRPGRFDRLVYVPLPDTSAREEILKVHTRLTPLHADVNLGSIANATPGYTGADLTAVVRQAALAALEEDFNTPAVAFRHFHQALKEIYSSPAPTPKLLALYRRFERH